MSFTEPLPGNLRFWAENGSEMEARAAAEVWKLAVSYNGVGWACDICLEVAKAVMRTMSTPTKEMLEAGNFAIAENMYTDGYESSGYYCVLEPHAANEAWERMMKAAQKRHKKRRREATDTAPDDTGKSK